jgi:hypothetical protein
VTCGAQCGDVVGCDVLHLVDQQCHPGADVGGQIGDRGEQLQQVDLDITGIGPAGDGRRVDARLPAIPQFGVSRCGAQREGLQDSEYLVNPVRGAVAQREITHRPVQCGRQWAAQPAVRSGFDFAGAPPSAHRHRPELAE